MKSPLSVGSATVALCFSVFLFFLADYRFGQFFSIIKHVSSTIHQNPPAALQGWSTVYIQRSDLALRVPTRAPGLPLRLKIPKIHVDSVVEYVGLTEHGAMDVPRSRDDVAWLELGLRPGDNGSAVIAGHYGYNDGKGSVFDNLHKLRKGDTLSVEDDSGATASFVVREIRRYDPQADAADVFGSSDGKPHLNLITCEGAWDDSEQGYPARLVVFTDKEPEQQ